MKVWKSARLSIALALMLTYLAGCAAPIATALWVWRGNPVPAKYDGLAKQKVVVLVRAAPGQRYAAMLASKEMTRTISDMLGQNVNKIKIIPPEKILGRIDEWGEEDPLEIAQALDADRLVLVDLESFSLYSGATLYQGRSSVHVQVYDCADGKVVWDESPDEIIYPPNSGIPISNMTEANFRRRFQENLSFMTARNFFPYEPTSNFAGDVDAVLH